MLKNVWNLVTRFFFVNPNIIPVDVSKNQYSLFFRTTRSIDIINALDNIPYIIHKLLFENDNEISSDYFQIYLIRKDKYFTVGHYSLNNLEENINNNNIRFIFIRLNLITNKIINHVNCLIIDKINKRIYVFEPQHKLKFNIDILKSIDEFNCFLDYDFIEPIRMGNKIIQKNNFYCQTYVLMAYYLITKFYDYVDYTEYYDFLKKYMSNKYLAMFLIYIDKLLEENNILIGDFQKNYNNNKSFILEDDGDTIYIDFKSNTL